MHEEVFWAYLIKSIGRDAIAYTRTIDGFVTTYYYYYYHDDRPLAAGEGIVLKSSDVYEHNNK